MGSGIGQFPFEAMAEEEPDYASLQSRGGPPSEEAPHPFWSERVQDEFRLQQARPRELDRLASRNYQDGENTLGMEGPQGQEPPYGSPGMRSAHDGLIREAVEDVLAENEALRRRVTDLENFSSARTGSTRQYQSTTSRSVELRSPEPDYSALDQLAEEDGFQRGQAMEQEQSIGNRPVSMQESSQPRSLFSGLMERTRTGSAERWNALRNFLRFQPREAEMASRPQGFQQTVSRPEEMSSQLYRDRSPGRPGNSWERISSSVPRRDPMAEVGVAGNSLQISGLESASMSRPQWSTMQVGSTPPTNQIMTPRAGLAHARDQSLLFGFPPPPSFPDVRSSMPTSSNRLAHRPVLQSQVVSETRLGRQDQGIEALNVRVGNGCGEEPKPTAGDGRGRDPFITDLIELSPPRVEGMVQQSARLDSAPLSAWQNPLFQPADGQRVTELLRGYNVDEGTGLRGVQLAQPRREREPIPVIHMPEREYGALSEQAPPPSLDLLGLDPVPIQQYLAEHPQSGHKPPAALTPCMPGALSPFVPVVGAGSLPVAPQPPGPPGPFESPRSGQNTARSVYTPGGTRVPDGPPPVTPRVSFSPTVDYTHVEGADFLPVYPSGETQGNGASTQPTISPSMIPPAPPMAPMVLPPPMAPGLGGCAPHVGPSLVGGPGPRVEEPSRLVYHLPPLSVEPGTQDASVAAGDWVARVRPVLTTLSPSAHRWWESTHKTAVEFYQRWLIGEPSERLRVRSEVEAYRVDWSYLSLVNERGGVLILGALTPDLQTECVTTRMLSAVGLLFTIFVRYQPGGPSEKAAVLSFLSNPSSPASLSDAQSSLRRWLRLYNRTAELNLHYPDPSLLVKGLDRLGHHISKSSNAGFRLASYRHAQRLDYEPTQHTVLAFAQVLLGEVEQQLLVLDLSQAEKKARISKALAQGEERDDPPPKAKGPPPNREGMRSTAAKAKPKARIVGQEEEVVAPPCRFFMSPSGCRYGKSCNQQHPEIRKGEGRCYECGATTHLRPQCPRKEGPEESPKRAQRMKRLATRDAGSVGPEPESEASPPSTHGQVSGRLTSQEAPQAKAPPQGYGPKISRLSLSEPLGLLDGGATHALRPADDAEEYSKATPLKVGLATGETDDLRINKGGTLLSLDRETQPILPLGVAVRLLGMSVVWRENHCDIVHPIRGRIKVFLQRGCPEVPRALCIALIRELELKLQGSGTPSKSLQAVDAVDRGETSQRLSAALKSSDVLKALREWMKDAYPAVPDPLLDKVVPSRFWKPEACSFNRHTRRKVERGKVLLHLFSGSQSWSHPSYNYTLNIEKERGWDLLDDSTFGYLLESAMKGCIAGIVAGPPCRTWSRLRSSSDNGPPPLRAREGVCRFGYTDLDPSYKEVVDGDTCLLLRSLFLVEVMQAARQALAFQPGFVFLEHPADPMTYMECRHPASRQSVESGGDEKPPSVWVWPEMQAWLDRLQLHVARFDQGYFGHDAVKPTQVATNSGRLWEALHAKFIPLKDLWHVDRGGSIAERIQASHSHAAWAPDLVKELQGALKAWVQQIDPPESEELRLHRFQAVCEAALSKVDKLEEWRQHCMQGHLPWRRDCLACLESAAYMRPHRRKKHPVFFNMMADLAGPYQAGEDTEVRKGRHIMLVVYPFPRWSTPAAKEDVPIPDPDVCSFGEGDLLDDARNAEVFPDFPDPFALVGEETAPAMAPSKIELKALDKEEARWEGVKDTLSEPCQVVNLTFVEILPNKSATTVASALSRVYARLRGYGFPVYGLFTDRGGEMVNKTIRTWCEARSIVRRTTAPESPASNGRTERILGLIRREARALLYAAQLKPVFWPHAVRHASEQRTRQALQALGLKTHAMVPFWALVTIRARTWSDKKWSTRAVQGRVAAPSVDVERGWLVRIEDQGVVRFYVSTLLYLDAKRAMGPPVLLESSYPPPDHRHRTKKPGPSASTDDVPAVDEGSAVDAADGSSWPLPVRRHLSKSPAGTVLQGADPIPGSLLESLSELRSASSLAAVAAGVGRLLPAHNKLAIEEDLPVPARLSKVVGPNPSLSAQHTPLPGRYEQRGIVRYCSLTPMQWEAIRDIRPGQVPGLGGLWTILTRQYLLAPVARCPSDLVPVCMFRERYRRDWGTNPVLSATMANGMRLDIACMQSVERFSTTSGGEYMVCCFHDLVQRKDAVLLLWIEMQMMLVHEPYQPPAPPRVAKLQVAGPCWDHPPELSAGGGDLLSFPGLCGQSEAKKRLAVPEIRALRAELRGREPQNHGVVWSEQVPYSFIADGVVLDEFEIGSGGDMSLPTEEAAIVPEEVDMPKERAVKVGVRSGRQVESVSERIQGEGGLDYHWYDCLPSDPLYLESPPEDVAEVDSLLEEMDVRRSCKLRVIREQEFLASLKEVGSPRPEPEVLHTHAVPLSEVYADIESWKAPLLDEFNSIVTTHRAMRHISRSEIRDLEKSGKQIQYVPGKLVATVKAGTAAKKARIVACGNFLGKERPSGSPTLSKSDIFAGALDSLGLRAQLAASAVSAWKGAVLDVKTAFLTAPLQTKRSHRIVILRPPKVLVSAGIIEEGSLFLIEKALYGLQESPQDWCVERDRRFASIRWVGPNGKPRCLIQSQSDSSIWLVKEWLPDKLDKESGEPAEAILGLLGVYVDDLLITAEPQELSELVSVISKEWKCSPVQWLTEGVTFCGLEIRIADGVYYLHQGKYIAELRQRHEDIKTLNTLPQFRVEDPMEGDPRLEDIRLAQKHLGELTWVSCRSRPDVSFSVSKASRLVSRNPKFAIKCARHILAYLFATADYKLKYGVTSAPPEMEAELPFKRSPGLVEAFSDASFGCEDERSQSGIAVLLGGCLVGWLSVPEPFTTLSTCEAELVSSCEALTLSQAVIPLWREMLGVPTRWVTITDSVSAAAVLLYPAGSWRTRHLRLRCRVFQEYIEQELLVLAHVKGQFQLADLLTKALTPPRIKQLLHYLDVDLGTLNEKVNDEEGVSGTRQAPKAVKALFVLSCLMNPVRAQPNSDLREVSSAWFWAMWIVAACCVAGFVALFLQWDRCRRQRRSEGMGLKQGLAEVEEFVAAEREEVLEASKPKGVPPYSVLLCKAPTVKAPPPRLSDAAETQAPVRPVKRPPPFMLSAHVMPIRSVPKPTPERGRASYTEVETPPRQHSSELPALLSYEELIARSLRRELSREPTSAEVEREIFLMRLRHQESRSRSSRGSETDTESSSDSTVSSGIQDPTATSSSQPFPSAPSLSPGQATAKVPSSRFQYLEPAPTPVIRILGSRVDEEGNTVHEAVRVDGGSPVPVDLYSRPHRMSSSSPPLSHQGMSEISSGSDQNAGITTSINEPPNDAPVSDAVEAEESTSEEAGASEYSELDVQIAEATLLLQQNTDVQFAVGLGHLSETQRALYRRIVARQRRGLEEVD